MYVDTWICPLDGVVQYIENTNYKIGNKAKVVKFMIHFKTIAWSPVHVHFTTTQFVGVLTYLFR